ncbi:antitermination protein [Pantoea sp. Al-1710]|uniref:Antitermination protein n=1 Tax=Candidatus Pantoea communis TaxID=2608354 RepID=A0ABX0RI51_9GAMM|nr:MULTISPECIES: antitermination protein [Pantoea]NIG12982.1 antitermination protein [Pantoea sp. Cy-640]NIG17317.1 antitermination protein [Pantoea communis]
MNLEKTLRFHYPKSLRITDDVPSTSNDALRAPEVLAAIGLAQAQEGFGMAAFFGKMGVSQNEKNKAVGFLMKIARKRLMGWRTFNALPGRKRQQLSYLISLFAFETYCRTAEDAGSRCPYCHGRGMVRDVKASKALNMPVDKPCSKCEGKGYKKVKVTQLMAGVMKINPEFSRRTFFRRVKPIIDELVSECHKAESVANSLFKAITQ